MIRRHVAVVLTSLLIATACAADGRADSVPASDLAGQLDLVPVAAIEAPIALATRPGDPDTTVYVASQSGSVHRVDISSGRSEEVVSLADRTRAEGEQGLLGLAFSLDGDTMYAHYTDLQGDTNVVAVPVRDGRPDLSSSRVLFFLEQPYANHNGGQLLVDATGALLIGLGDGGSSGDPEGNGQDRSSLLGKILRISPAPAATTTAAAPYSIPLDNPYANSESTAPEILFLGLRNPWRFSIDTVTGEYWIADVGQNSREEINRVPASAAGANFGWNVREGTRSFKGTTTDVLIDPTYEWTNVGGSSAIGGFVYRGRAIDRLQGKYVFADFGQRGLFVLDPASGDVAHLDLPVEAVVSFGQDRSGELYVLSLDSGVLALRPRG